jgi:ATP-dependent RNA helicase HelY
MIGPPHRPQYQRRRRKSAGAPRAHQAPRFSRLKAGADSRLKKSFDAIGTPVNGPFVPDPFQRQAVAAVDRADCLVIAPTGSGKTWIAVKAIEQIFQNGGRAWYASPLKALTNSKLSEFSEIFGAAHVGILTGDRKENADAPIIVGTTEILRNQLYDAMHRGETLATDFVVLDEAHFLGDPDRGVVWEETMIYLPQRIPLLLLSATIGNGGQISQWLTTIRQRECRVVAADERPVPLMPLFLHPTGTLLPLLTSGQADARRRLSKKVAALASAQRPPLLAPPGKLPPFGDILRLLRKYRLLPAIFFLKSRADCDNALPLCSGNLLTDPRRKERLASRIAELIDPSPHLSHHRQRGLLENLAVGAHHSGQLPAWKLVIETLMTEGLLDAVFATSTVAAGVNFPARTVVILNSDRFNGREFIPLDATEFHQMTGRAGRRGMDRIGFALILPGKYMDIRHVGRLADSPPADVHSQIRINFSMTLNLLRSHTPPQIEELLKRSFATYLLVSRRGQRALRQRQADVHGLLWEDFQRHLAFLKETGFAHPDDRLTDDGRWASQLRIDQPLMVAEGLRRDVLPDSDPALLAAVMAAFVNEKESDDRLEGRLLPNRLVKQMNHIRKQLSGFAHHLTQRGFQVRPFYDRPAAALFAWAMGLAWERVAVEYQMAEGDLSMLVLRTADHLRHVGSLREVFPRAAATAVEAMQLILRDPVIPEGELTI